MYCDIFCKPNEKKLLKQNYAIVSQASGPVTHKKQEEVERRIITKRNKHKRGEKRKRGGGKEKEKAVS